MAMRLYYDGGCNLCHVSKLRVERWAERAGVSLVALPLQSAEAVDKGYAGDAMILESDRVYSGVDAWLELTKIAPWPLQIVFAPLRLPGVKVLAKIGYRIVAKFRYKWFGTRECVLPSK